MGVLHFITMSYTTKSEQSEWKIHVPMINACGYGGKGHSIFFIRTVPPRDDWNPNPQIFVDAL